MLVYRIQSGAQVLLEQRLAFSVSLHLAQLCRGCVAIADGRNPYRVQIADQLPPFEVANDGTGHSQGASYQRLLDNVHDFLRQSRNICLYRGIRSTICRAIYAAVSM